MSDTIHIYCPVCGGGPHAVPEGRPFACFNCHVELVAVRSCGFVMLMWHVGEKEDSDGRATSGN